MLEIILEKLNGWMDESMIIYIEPCLHVYSPALKKTIYEQVIYT